jgi:hypothetical protein
VSHPKAKDHLPRRRDRRSEPESCGTGRVYIILSFGAFFLMSPVSNNAAPGNVRPISSFCHRPAEAKADVRRQVGAPLAPPPAAGAT